MKGLIFRQLYLSKKQILISYAVTLIVILFLNMTMLSFSYGNLGKLEGTELKDVLYIQFMFLTPLCFSSTLMSLSVLNSDFKSKWQLYSYTLPVSAKQDALSRTIFTFICFLMSVVPSAIFSLILTASSKTEFSFSFYIIALSLTVVCLFFKVITEVSMLLFKNPNMAYLISFGVIIGAATLKQKQLWSFLTKIGLNEESPDLNAVSRISNSFLHKYFWVIPLAIAAAFAVSYFGNLIALKRRPV